MLGDAADDLSARCLGCVAKPKQARLLLSVAPLVITNFRRGQTNSVAIELTAGGQKVGHVATTFVSDAASVGKVFRHSTATCIDRVDPRAL